MTLFFCKIRGYFKAGDGDVKESVGRRSWCCYGTAKLCWEERVLLCCLLAQLPCWAVEGNKCSQNLIVSSCELVSPLSHLIPTFAYCECHFNTAFLDFITCRLSTASETAFWMASGLFCTVGRKTYLLFFSWAHWLPVTPAMVAEVVPVSTLGLLPAGYGCGWVVLGLSEWHTQQLVKWAYGCQEQTADLGQICSWPVTQPSVQLALVFAASF